MVYSDHCFSWPTVSQVSLAIFITKNSFVVPAFGGLICSNIIIKLWRKKQKKKHLRNVHVDFLYYIKKWEVTLTTPLNLPRTKDSQMLYVCIRSFLKIHVKIIL